MRFHAYFNTVVQLIQQYKGDVPLAAFLKTYFAAHKKHGSKDRKLIAHACYCFYRLGNTLKTLPTEERLRLALFICNSQPEGWAVVFEPNWLENWQEELMQRISFAEKLYADFNANAIFSFAESVSLSVGINAAAFSISHIIQPDLFLRVRPGRAHTVLQLLEEKDIVFTKEPHGCLRLPNNTPVQQILAVNKDVVVQDYASQQVGVIMQRIKKERTESGKRTIAIWDCCAASGGKSIMAKDIFGAIDLLATDVRGVILRNLQERFSEASLHDYRSQVMDLSKPANDIQDGSYELIICDVPCSGSGTWGRTPEQLYHFVPDQLAPFILLQQQITAHVLPKLQKVGYFLYITCSVFAAENEQRVQWLQQKGLVLLEQQLIQGYTLKADTMFAALLQKP